MNLVKLMQQGKVTKEDVVYFEDMFQPGIESLPYILDQVPEEYRPRIYVRCLAQSIDPDDFVHVCGMQKWMGLYEKMVNEFVTGVLATNEEMVAHMRIAGWTAPIYNISGLAFGKDEVLERIGGADNIRPFAARKRRVGFAARFDQEKSYHAWTLQCCSLNVKEIRDPTIITRSDYYIFQPRFNHAVSSWPRA